MAVFERIKNLPGTYILVLKHRGNRRCACGALGQLKLQAGFYLYVGSAFGPGGIAARCHHHLRISERPHWHIDYLRATMTLEEIWFSHDYQRREHQWSGLLTRSRGSTQPFPGFGSSDCDCTTHLFYFPRPPSFPGFRQRACRQLSDHAPICREPLAGGMVQTLK